MSLNRYRLRHLVRAGHRGAVRAHRLLERPDRVIGLILLWSNFLNALATGVATVIALELFGDSGIAVATGVMTLLLLIFTDIAPKTLAAMHPERIAFPAAFALIPLLWASRPVVHAVNYLSSGLLRLCGVNTEESTTHSLSSEELRSVVVEAGAMIPRRHQKMLLSILDLEKASVNDIMVPRHEIRGIDLSDDIAHISAQLQASQYTRLPVYREDIDHIIGFIHLRGALKLIMQGALTAERVQEIIYPAYFIPENTPLNTQLVNFQREQRRIGLVVDEYGDILGLATLEDILEEIVGEFTTDPSAGTRQVRPQGDGSYLVDGSASVRIINRVTGWQLPTDGPRTLNGLLLEYLEAIPAPGTSVMITEHPIEITTTRDNVVLTARICPARARVAE